MPISSIVDFKINEFMEKLKQKIINTWEVYDKDPENYSQLIDLSEYKKYIIKGVGDEETPQTLQDAVNSIYQYLVYNFFKITFIFR